MGNGAGNSRNNKKFKIHFDFKLIQYFAFETSLELEYSSEAFTFYLLPKEQLFPRGKMFPQTNLQPNANHKIFRLETLHCRSGYFALWLHSTEHGGARSHTPPRQKAQITELLVRGFADGSRRRLRCA